MHKGPIQSRITLKCHGCGEDFQAKRSDTKWCESCKIINKIVLTQESCERHREKRTARQREYFRCRSKARREEIQRRRNERYASDAEYREHMRALARESYSRCPQDREKRNEAVRRYREKRGNRHIVQRVENQRAQKFRKDACEHCGNDDQRVLSVHHKKPFSKGGLTVKSNLETLCRNCHAIVHFEMGAAEGKRAV